MTSFERQGLLLFVGSSTVEVTVFLQVCIVLFHRWAKDNTVQYANYYHYYYFSAGFGAKTKTNKQLKMASPFHHRNSKTRNGFKWKCFQTSHMFCVSLWYRVRLTYTLSKAVKSITAQLSWDGDWCHASKDAIHPLFTPLACCSESCFPRGGHKEVWESNQALVYCLRQHDPLHTPLHVLPSFQLRRAVYTCVCMDHLWYRHVADTLVLGVFARSRRYNHWTSSTMDFCCLSISTKSYDF